MIVSAFGFIAQRAMLHYAVVWLVGAVVPVPDPPAVSPGEGVPPGVFFVSPEVVPGVDDGAALGLAARGSPSSVGPQPATKIDSTNNAKRAMETFFMNLVNDSAPSHASNVLTTVVPMLNPLALYLH